MTDRAPRPSQHAGRVWRFGDNLNTDVLAPGAYMKFGIEEIARHCLEAVEPRLPGSNAYPSLFRNL
jgi:3-isopropylmalate/(R)-2-methylmalate dehydratase small subunit